MSAEGVDVVVVGGGVVGAAVLHAATEAGLREVALFEKGTFACGSTGQSAAIVRTFNPDPRLSDLSAEGLRAVLRATYAEGEAIGYVRTGLLYLAPPAERDAVAEEARRLRRAGEPIELLEPSDGRRRFPHLEWQDVGLAVFEPFAGYVDPERLTRLWIDRARAAGARAHEGVRVLELLRDGDRVVGVRTASGDVRARAVVLATGAWGASLPGAPPALAGALRSRAIQMSLVRWRDRASQYPVLIDGASGLYGRPEPSSSFFVGLPTDDWDVDPDVAAELDREAAAEVARRSSARLPDLANAELAGGRRGFDGYTRDGRGVVGPVPGTPGLVAAVGFSGGGLKIAPGVGRRVAAELAQR